MYLHQWPFLTFPVLNAPEYAIIHLYLCDAITTCFAHPSTMKLNYSQHGLATVCNFHLFCTPIQGSSLIIDYRATYVYGIGNGIMYAIEAHLLSFKDA